MRRVMTWMARRLKRDRAWTLDAEMSSGALLALVCDALVKALRGQMRRIGLGEARGLVFLGHGVTLRNKAYIRVGRNFIAEDYSEIQGLSRRGIVFGDRVTIGRFAMIRPSGYYGGEPGEGLRVGDRSSIGAYSYIGCSGFVTIGRDVMIAPRVSIHAENHNIADAARPIKEQGVTRAPVVIEDDCWIGSHAVILAGVTIGCGSVVSAGSVVTRDVAPYSIVGGVPARLIRSRMASEPVAAAAEGAAHDPRADHWGIDDGRPS